MKLTIRYIKHINNITSFRYNIRHETYDKLYKTHSQYYII